MICYGGRGSKSLVICYPCSRSPVAIKPVCQTHLYSCCTESHQEICIEGSGLTNSERASGLYTMCWILALSSNSKSSFKLCLLERHLAHKYLPVIHLLGVLCLCIALYLCQTCFAGCPPFTATPSAAYPEGSLGWFFLAGDPF